MIGHLDQRRVVRRDDDRHAALVDEPPQQAHDRLRPCGVELRGRLVGDQQPRLVREGAGDRDALLLAARELLRAMVHPVGEVDEPQQLAHAPSAPRRVDRRRRSGTSTFSAALRIGIRPNAWKTNPIVSRRYSTSSRLRQRRDVGAVHDHRRSRRRTVEAADHVQERRLPRARAAVDDAQLRAGASRPTRRWSACTVSPPTSYSFETALEADERLSHRRAPPG